MGKCLMPMIVEAPKSELPTDGKSRFGLRVTVATGKDVMLFLRKNNTATLTIDWGDGSANSTFTTSGILNTPYHTYANYGDYEIKMWISSGSGTYGFSYGDSRYTVVGGTAQARRNMLLYCYVGENVTSIGIYSFQYCYSLTKIVIPSNVTKIDTKAFYLCYALTSIIIPDSVTSIGTDAFVNCHSLKTYVLERTENITTLHATSALTGINSSTKIYVPDALVATYKSANNWSTYADYIYPISEKGVAHDD